MSAPMQYRAAHANRPTEPRAKTSRRLFEQHALGVGPFWDKRIPFDNDEIGMIHPTKGFRRNAMCW